MMHCLTFDLVTIHKIKISVTCVHILYSRVETDVTLILCVFLKNVRFSSGSQCCIFSKYHRKSRTALTVKETGAHVKTHSVTPRIC